MLGAYRVIRKLGEGGMGEVLLGRAPDDQLVVLKVPLHPSAETAARLKDEARVGFRLRHDHIVKTRDFFFAGKKPVLVIDFVDGASLKDLREQVGPLPAVMVAHIGKQICSALAWIHQAKDEEGRPLHMLHRDVTPGNILVDRRGHVLLIDLGIARSDENTAGKTMTGMLKGTFRYLSPDLFAGMSYSPGTDIWALGVSLFEAAVGRKAARGHQQAVLAAILDGRIMNKGVDEQLHHLLERTFFSMLRMDDRSRRMCDAAQLAQVFAQIESKLGDGAEVARRIMATQPQGDVSGEFGADDVVPTIPDAGAQASSALGQHPFPLPPPPDPRSLDDESALEVSSPTQALRSPRTKVDPVSTLSIPIIVFEEDVDLSELDGPAPPVAAARAPPSVRAASAQLSGHASVLNIQTSGRTAESPPIDAARTIAMPAMATPSSMAPPTVMLSAAHTAPGSSDAAPTVVLRASSVGPGSGEAPTVLLHAATAKPASVDAAATVLLRAATAKPGSADAAPTMLLSAMPTAPKPKPPIAMTPRPTLDLPVYVDGDDD